LFPAVLFPIQSNEQKKPLKLSPKPHVELAL